MRFNTPRLKNLSGGILMVVLGLLAVAGARDYRLGTINRMGPGFFPTAIGCVLALSGLAIAATALMSAGGQPAKAVRAEWRGWICIVLAILAFALMGHSVGLVAATFAVVFIAAIGDRQNSLRDALLLAGAIVAVAVVVFWWALKIQLPLFAWQWP